MLSSNMLLLNLILLIDVTFSTPTGDFTQNAIVSDMAILRQLRSGHGQFFRCDDDDSFAVVKI